VLPPVPAAFGAARHRVAEVWKQILGTDILATEQEDSP